jgi:hypothetical protein
MAVASGDLYNDWGHVELTSGILARDEYLRAVERIVEFLRAAGVRHIFVAYGFGCDCPEEQLYQDVPMMLDRLLPFIADSESAGFYRVGKDNLHVKPSTAQAEFLFCHESDIHFITEDVGLLERLRDRWLGDGYRSMYLKRGDECEPVPFPA